MNKEVLREKYKKLRKEVLDKKERDSLITRKVLLSEEYKKANTIAIYVSKEDEVDTKELIDSCLAAGKTVCVPVAFPDSRDMCFYHITSRSVLKKGPFGILIPEPTIRDLVFPNEIDLFIVPMVAFDRNNNRLGQGGGYYDTYLAKANGDTIGIAYDIQMTGDMVVEPHDVKVKKIITDNRESNSLQKY